MDQFVSHFFNKLDAKGRISIPAPFRAVLVRDGFEGLYCYPALNAPALDAGGNRLLQRIEGQIAGIAPYTPEHDQYATALYGVSEVLKIDRDGRINLTETLKQHAEITDGAVFVGQGDKFQIWAPAAFEIHRQRGIQRLRDRINARTGAALTGGSS